MDLQHVHDNNALIGHIKKPMLSREGTVDSEMLDFATENITTLHPDDSAEVVDSNGAEGNEMFSMTFKYNTPPIAEIICVKNVGAIVVCGFFMK